MHDQPTQAAPLVVPGQGSRTVSRRAARRRKAPGPAGEGLRRLVPQALVVAFLAGGTSAFVADDKAVRLSVDGVPRTLHTFADDVEELLADQGLAVGAHDIVAPAPAEALANGDEIVVRYGRPVALTLDGQRRQVWTTARTVDGALRQLGVRAEGAYLSVSRGAPISRNGLALDVRTERTITFLADGRERTVRTNAATVREALAEAGITLSAQDAVSVVPESFPRDGQTVTVLRITGSKVTREEAVPYAVERTRDPELFVGTEVVDRQGAAGCPPRHVQPADRQRRQAEAPPDRRGDRPRTRQPHGSGSAPGPCPPPSRAPTASTGARSPPASPAAARTPSTPRGRTAGSTSSTPAPGAPRRQRHRAERARRRADVPGEEAVRAAGSESLAPLRTTAARVSRGGTG